MLIKTIILLLYGRNLFDIFIFYSVYYIYDNYTVTELIIEELNRYLGVKIILIYKITLKLNPYLGLLFTFMIL